MTTYHNLGASAIMKPQSDYACVIRIDIAETAFLQAEEILTNLTQEVQWFLLLASGVPHNASSERDFRGRDELAYVGFGPTFFWDRSSGNTRFKTVAVPEVFSSMQLPGDSEMGVRSDLRQADLLVYMESSQYGVLLEGVDRLVRHVRQNDLLLLRDLHIGVSKGNRRNHLGFIDGIGNAGNSGYPAIHEIAFPDPSSLPAGLEGGTFMVFRKYAFDDELWNKYSIDEQEQRVGISKSTGQILPENFPLSHAALLKRDNENRIFRRGINYTNLNDEGKLDRGLLFISFQASLSTFAGLYGKLFNAGLYDQMLSARSITPHNSDAYFVPDFRTWQWGFIGQCFFDPGPYAMSLSAAQKLYSGRVDESIDSYRELVDLYPHHLLGYVGLANLYGELNDVTEALTWSREAGRRFSPNYLIDSAFGWAYYLANRYTDAVEAAGRAIQKCFADDFRGFPYHTLAASLLILGRLDEAAVAVERAMVRVTDSPLIFFTAANIYERSGNLVLANSKYDSCLRLVKELLDADAADGLSIQNFFRLDMLHYSSETSSEIRGRVHAMVAEYLSSRSDISFKKTVIY